MTKTLPSREDEWIALIETLASKAEASYVRVGIGDDAAVILPPPEGFETLVTTDQIIENTHFVRSKHPPGPLGAKTVTRGLSDLAAMGGEPLWFTLSLGLPADLDPRWLEQFLIGMFSVTPTIAGRALPLVGGDVARAPFFAAHVTAVGAAPAGRALRRTAARPDDTVYVSGRLGGSALGLERLLAGEAGPEDAAVARHVSPSARVALGRQLLDWGVAACMDLSDGLSTDALRLARASRVALVLKPERVPQFPEAGLARALHGGEEYELLFTAPPELAIPAGFEGLELTRIGRVEEGEGLWSESGGEKRRLEPQGFRHFG